MCPPFYWLRWNLTNFFPGLASNTILQISTSQITRITELSKYIQPQKYFTSIPCNSQCTQCSNGYLKKLGERLLKTRLQEIPRWQLEGGSKILLPKVNSWRNAGDTPCRKNHQEEAKLQHLHSPSTCITSPLHVKWRNQEGSCAARCQLLPPAWEKQTTR
jgi:hypothetical protein